MASHGQLSATKIGARWLVERAAVEQRRSLGAHGGRPFASHNAWALLLLASGEEFEGIDPSVRSRLRRALELEGLERLAPRLGLRAKVLSFSAHPGEIPYLIDEPALMKSSISAAASQGIGLVSGREVDGYLQEDGLKKFAERHALMAAGLEGNVHLRLVPDQAWGLLDKRSMAPAAAVALDLAEEPDSRSAKAGLKALREIDRRHRARRNGRKP
jgi:hypothetical protein